MTWLLIEMALALAIGVAIVWWTMFSGRPKGERPAALPPAPAPASVPPSTPPADAAATEVPPSDPPPR